MPDLDVALVYQHDLVFGLDEVNGLKGAGIDQELRNAGGLAARARGVAQPFPGDHLFVRLSQMIDDPWFQIRIAEVGQRQRRFDDIAPVVRSAPHDRIRLVISHRSQTGRRRKQAPTRADPGKISGGKVRNHTLGMRCCGAGAKQTSEKTD